jgi:hypothetical protein
MRKDYEKIFSHLALPEPPAGLFERIILAIRREQELQKTKRLLFGFFSLLIISFIAMPFSWNLLTDQVKSFGTLSFLSAAVSNFGVFFTLWKEFSLAILESIPIMGLVVFIINIAIFLFTVRLFLYKKRLLFEYIAHSFN